MPTSSSHATPTRCRRRLREWYEGGAPAGARGGAGHGRGACNLQLCQQIFAGLLGHFLGQHFRWDGIMSHRPAERLGRDFRAAGADTSRQASPVANGWAGAVGTRNGLAPPTGHHQGFRNDGLGIDDGRARGAGDSPGAWWRGTKAFVRAGSGRSCRPETTPASNPGCWQTGRTPSAVCSQRGVSDAADWREPCPADAPPITSTTNSWWRVWRSSGPRGPHRRADGETPLSGAAPGRAGKDDGAAPSLWPVAARAGHGGVPLFQGAADAPSAMESASFTGARRTSCAGRWHKEKHERVR